MSHTTTAFIGLGSNLGAREQHLLEAVQAVSDIPGMQVTGRSSVYLTEPQDEVHQPWFANQVLRLECTADAAGAHGASPEDLLAALQDIERRLGRVRVPGARFGPRVIDLDLLLFGREVRSTPALTLPHPRMARRAFVLVPLCELAPDFRLPDGRTTRQLLGELSYVLQGNRIFQS